MSLQLSRPEAARELLQRRQARESLIAFASYTLPTYEEAPHHTMIARKLEAVERGDIKRLMIFMPPRHGKSELASRRFPAWYLGRNPKAEIIAASYNSDLAMDFGREVRGIVNEAEYRALFPDVHLRVDSKAADRWHTNHGGAYRASGVGTAMTGRGADLLLIDDPVKDREEADSELRRNRVWDWYRSTAYTRLSPNGRIVVIQCMVGGTIVTLADGTGRRLDEITPGDVVASYRDGQIVEATVKNWTPQGRDCVFAIKTKTGIITRANARHPFLVDRGGGPEWVKLRDLRPGDRIHRVIGASGGALSVPLKDVSCRSSAAGFVSRTITRPVGPTASGPRLSMRRLAGRRISSTDTASPWLNMKPCLPSKADAAQCVASHREITCEPIGAESYASITATGAERFGAFCVTTATLRSDTERQSAFCSPPPPMFGIELDEISSIEPDGVEEVYDIEVEGTENFIADGVVSHNTRWHEDDLSGRLLAQGEGDEWDVLSLPAIYRGEALWPERFPMERLEQIKATVGPREWSALYMQSPQPDEGTFFQRDWFGYWEQKPTHLRIYGTSDYAVTDEGGDYTVHRVWGVDHAGNLYRLDGWRGQTSADRWIDEKLDLIAKWKPSAWFGESGVIQKAVHPMLTRRMRERNVFCRMEWLPSIHDKPTRARGFQARAAMGKVLFEKGADVSEFLSFPAGKHDDEVDVASLIGRALDEAHPAIVPVTVKPNNPPDLWGRPRREEADDWRVV